MRTVIIKDFLCQSTYSEDDKQLTVSIQDLKDERMITDKYTFKIIKRSVDQELDLINDALYMHENKARTNG